MQRGPCPSKDVAEGSAGSPVGSRFVFTALADPGGSMRAKGTSAHRSRDVRRSTRTASNWIWDTKKSSAAEQCDGDHHLGNGKGVPLEEHMEKSAGPRPHQEIVQDPPETNAAVELQQGMARCFLSSALAEPADARGGFLQAACRCSLLADAGASGNPGAGDIVSSAASAANDGRVPTSDAPTTQCGIFGSKETSLETAPERSSKLALPDLEELIQRIVPVPAPLLANLEEGVRPGLIIPGEGKGRWAHRAPDFYKKEGLLRRQWQQHKGPPGEVRNERKDGRASCTGTAKVSLLRS
eukprot:jgi/Botrbrau1/6191/Bobra.0344s0031.1